MINLMFTEGDDTVVLETNADVELTGKIGNDAEIDEAQDLNVVYGIKESLDGFNIYSADGLEKFNYARFRSIRDLTHAQEPQRKTLCDATDSPRAIL